MPHRARCHFDQVADDDRRVRARDGRLVCTIDLVIQRDGLLREGQGLLEIAHVAMGRAYHYPQVHKRLGAQSVRLPLQDVPADFQDVAMAALAEEEIRHADAGLRGLVLLVQRQRGIA